jgi:regulatory protein
MRVPKIVLLTLRRSQLRSLLSNIVPGHSNRLAPCSSVHVFKYRRLITTEDRGGAFTRNRKPHNKSGSDETNIRLDPEKARERIFQRAAKLLAARPRSVAELRERLSTTRGGSTEIVELVIERLREYGYLDDAKFAQSFASNRIRERPLGRRRLQRDLWLKKVDKKTADEALDQVLEAIPEEDLIDQAIAKRLRVRGRPQTREEAKKLFDHLLRRGFEFELVSEKLRALTKTNLEE